MNPPAIEAVGLTKRFGEVEALTGVDLEVAQGTVFGLLGPNGAGKTTAVRILTTVLSPTGGVGRVLGHDVVTEAAQVRASIGLAGQFAAVDENLTGRENLRLVGRLATCSQASTSAAGHRAARAVRAQRRGRPAGQDLLGWHAATARPGRGVGPPAAGGVPGRADHGARPAEPHRPVGRDRGAGGRGDDRAAHHPVPRGGRPPGR